MLSSLHCLFLSVLLSFQKFYWGNLSCLCSWNSFPSRTKWLPDKMWMLKTLLYQVVPLKGKSLKLLMNLTFWQGGKGVVLYSYGYNLSNGNDITSAVLFLHVLHNKGNLEYLQIGNLLTSVKISAFFFFPPPVGWVFHLQTLVLMFQLISYEVDHAQKSSKDSKECQIVIES